MTDPTPTPITPECRYGHGQLTEVTGDPELRYAVRSVFKTQEGDQKIITESPYAFTARLYRCRFCGYLELFDDEA